MADRMLLITWKTPVPGLEARSLEVFDEAMGILGRAQQEGRIESFEVALMDPNGEIDGAIRVHGTQDQITGLRLSEDFMRNTVEAQMCVEGIRHLEASTNARVAQLMTMYREAITKVPQRA